MRKELLFPACAFLASCTAVPDDDPATATSNVRTARIRTPQGVRTVSYRMVDGRPVSGGDIILPDSVLRSDLYAAPALVDHWDDGVVPFVAGSLPQFYEDELTDARRTFQR